MLSSEPYAMQSSTFFSTGNSTGLIILSFFPSFLPDVDRVVKGILVDVGDVLVFLTFKILKY